jgi:hypothetical protein
MPLAAALLLLVFNATARAQDVSGRGIDSGTVGGEQAGAAGAALTVLDNKLLDRVFANQRAAAKRAPTRTESASAPQDAANKRAAALFLPSDSFEAKITSRMPSSLAAALRFAEHGRKQIGAGEYQKALSYLERAVSLGMRNYLPYLYYYLAESHFHLANYHSAKNFLDVAESWLHDTDWMMPIAHLRQQNQNALAYARAEGIIKGAY